MQMPSETYDYVIIGSGFGGSAAALRLAEKGYRVLVLERGKRWNDRDFPKTNWNLRKFLWMPAARCFGIMRMSWLNGALFLSGSGVGGGSLGFANVLMEPSDEMYASPMWRELADWKSVLRPFFDTAKRMLGATANPKLCRADAVLKEIAADRSREEMFRPCQVGVYFGEPGVTVPDPYFNGEGPERAGCQHDGACLLGCRNNAKNSLVKNYLYLAEKRGVKVRAEAEVHRIAALADIFHAGARYEVEYHSPTGWRKRPGRVRARNVIVSAGVLGTLPLLLRCRDDLGTLPKISARLGDAVRTNSECLVAVVNRKPSADYSEGVAIGSIFKVDETTNVEPVRHPNGSSLMFILDTTPLIAGGRNFFCRLGKVLWETLRHPIDAINSRLPPLAKRATILLVMQSKDNRMRLRLGKRLFGPFGVFGRARTLIADRDSERPVPAKIEIAHELITEYAKKTDGIALSSLSESLLNIPTIPHILGGCPIGVDDEHGVVGLDFQVHNYPGLYVIDGSIVPANPGVNPSLTITALAEYAMSFIPRKNGTPADSTCGAAVSSPYGNGASVVDGYIPEPIN